MSPALIHGSISFFVCLVLLCHLLPFFTDGPGPYLEFIRKNSFIVFLSPTSLGPRLAAFLSSLQAVWSSVSWENLSLHQLSHVSFSVPTVSSLDLSFIVIRTREITTFLNSILSLCNTVLSIVHPSVRQYTKKDALTQLIYNFCTLSSILNTTVLLLSFSVHSLFVLNRWFKSRDIVLATVIAAGAEQESYWANWRRSAAVAVVGFLGFVPVWGLLWWAVEYVSEAIRYFQLAAQDEGLDGQDRRAGRRRVEELITAAEKEQKELGEMARRLKKSTNVAELQKLHEREWRFKELVKAARKELDKVKEIGYESKNCEFRTKGAGEGEREGSTVTQEE